MSSNYRDSAERYEEPAYREHVSGPLQFQPQPTQPNNGHYGQQVAQGWQQQPQYGAWPQPPHNEPQQQGYAGYTQQQPYYGGYNPQAYYGYPPAYYPYAWQPAKPKRDTYLFVISIIATVCSSLALLTGIIVAILLLFALLAAAFGGNRGQEDQLLGGIAMLIALTIAGLGGGSFSLYHSIRSLMRSRSIEFRMPKFWLFLIAYIITLVIGFFVRGSDTIASNLPVTISLIFLAGLFPALAILALGARRVRDPKETRWPTTWRRFAVALVSGATSAILFAIILEAILGFIVQAGLNLNGFNISNTDVQLPNNGFELLYLFIIVAIIAPVVEETVKPLAVVVLMGRINSAKEAFILGLATGIGFDLVETVGYISSGNSNWVDIALMRSSAGLLHGFGAGMVALGCYYLVHGNRGDSLKKHRILIGIGCIVYAILQHAIWNGSFILALLPAPIGPALESGKIMIGSYPFEYIMFVYLIWTVLMLLFFMFVTGKLGHRNWLKPTRIERNRNMEPQTQQATQQQAAPAPTPAWQQGPMQQAPRQPGYMPTNQPMYPPQPAHYQGTQLPNTPPQGSASQVQRPTHPEQIR